MIRKNLPICLIFVLLALCGASRGMASPACSDCTCDSSCATRCDSFNTCGGVGVCAGSSLCVGGGGCLTVSDPNTFLERLRADPRQAASPEKGLVLARLTWRMAQHVEEGGLGAVYAGNTGFLLNKTTGRVSSPALAFVSREHLQTGGAWSGAPDLAVELRAAAARDWLKAGTRAVLVLDADTRTVSLYQRSTKVRVFTANDLLELPDVLPGWALRVAELFE